MSPFFEVSLLSTAYLPPVEYFFAVAHSGRVLIEQHENFQKQSWRSRCRIYSAAGPEDLSIPVVKDEKRGRPIRDIRIDYSEPWLQHHVRALSAAYNRSAFFDYYADDLIPLLESRPEFLFDLNMSLLEKLLELLGLQTPVELTESFVASVEDNSPAPLRSQNLFGVAGALPRKNRDCSTRPAHGSVVFAGRSRIQPKYRGESLLAEYGFERPYYQLFANQDPSSDPRHAGLDPVRHAGLDPASRFIPNLSIIDLLSAEGPDAMTFLR